jgi:hypothetical protein
LIAAQAGSESRKNGNLGRPRSSRLGLWVSLIVAIISVISIMK